MTDETTMIERQSLLRFFSLSLGLAALFAASLVSGTGPTKAQQRQVPARAPPPATAPTPPEAPPTGPVGVWIDHTGRGAVEISECSSRLCGRIVWMQSPLDKKGRPLVDKLNEDRRLRKRPICGLQIIGGLKQMRDGSWDGGWIYDPEQGESFDLELRMRAPDVLQVKGYKGLKFLSETFHWRRAPQQQLPACPEPSGSPA